MEYIVTKSIPLEELKEHKDYVGFLFKNENEVFNICETEEDVIKSNQWFKNLPLHTIVVSDDPIKPGDLFLAIAVNESLNGKTFKYVGPNTDGIDLIDLLDKDGVSHISTIHLLEGSYKFIRVANMVDKKKIVTRNIVPMGM